MDDLESLGEHLQLYDYRRRVLKLYADRNAGLARGDHPEDVWQRFGKGRDQLFSTHPQSALDPSQRPAFRGLSYFPFNPAAVVAATLDSDAGSSELLVKTSADETMRLIKAGTVRFETFGEEAALPVFWIDVYGGGLFLPFRDTTSPLESYGGRRYLFDTVKGSDFIALDARFARIQLDFNYAYNPSCAYNPRWSCPLAPPGNRLPFPIRAGEMKYIDAR
jgi:uncharacterized protein